jgi:hypothetical protein
MARKKKENADQASEYGIWDTLFSENPMISQKFWGRPQFWAPFEPNHSASQRVFQSFLSLDWCKGHVAGKQRIFDEEKRHRFFAAYITVPNQENYGI